MAAYEVLFTVGNSAPDSNDIFLTQGRAAELRFQLLDQFGAYPLDSQPAFLRSRRIAGRAPLGEPREKGRVTTVPSGTAEIRERPGGVDDGGVSNGATSPGVAEG